MYKFEMFVSGVGYAWDCYRASPWCWGLLFPPTVTRPLRSVCKPMIYTLCMWDSMSLNICIVSFRTNWWWSLYVKDVLFISCKCCTGFVVIKHDHYSCPFSDWIPFTFLKFVYYSRVGMWEDVLISCGILAGEYLGLTGARLDGADMLSCGLATHFVPSQVILFTK